ncbi:MAG: NAD(+)/NADH kinase [Sulfobacillus sp.]|nr:NAD(+)/NADH kinase [Sulfobacillus sp.]
MPDATHTIGLIINPMAGRDIRRLVAQASLQSGPEKALVGKRILAGIAGVTGMRVMMPDDRQGFFSYLQSEMDRMLPIDLIPLGPGEDETTESWVRLLEEAGAEALIVVGGDGTQRNVAQAHPRIPVLPVAGGTNNVACYLGDQTAGGYAVAHYVAEGLDPADVADREKVIHLTLDTGQADMALIDVALVRQRYTGALAVWNAEDVLGLVAAVADPIRPGLSNVASFVMPLRQQDDQAVWIRIGSPDTAEVVTAVLAPGLLGRFGVEGFQPLSLEDPLTLAMPEGGSLALDGERTIVVKPGQTLTVQVRRDGPYILDPSRILRAIGKDPRD